MVVVVTVAERKDWEHPGKESRTELRNALGNRSVSIRGLE